MKRWQLLLMGCLLVALGGLSCAPIGDDDSNGVTLPASLNQEAIPIGPPESLDVLKERVRAALDQVKNRDLLSTHGFWTVFHAILGNGLEARFRDTFTNEHIVALDYIRNGGQMSGLEFIVHENIVDGKDGIDVKIGPTFYGQGHKDQYVAEMAQLGLPLKTPFFINHKGQRREYSFEDFVRFSMYDTEVRGDVEFSWTILTVSQYYGTQLSWTNKNGDKVHFEDLIKHEVNQPIETAACGGTHRLFGLTWAWFIYMRDVGDMRNPVWQEAAARLHKYYTHARDNQYPDGSFSTEYFAKQARSPDLERRIGATGHIVEWLALYLPDDELRSPWMQHAVNSLVVMLLESRNQSVDGGSIYHAAHGLHIYYWRVWQADDALPSSKVIPPAPRKPG